MALSPETRIAQYEILGLVGVGGMGEGYSLPTSTRDQLAPPSALRQRRTTEALYPATNSVPSGSSTTIGSRATLSR